MNVVRSGGSRWRLWLSGLACCAPFLSGSAAEPVGSGPGINPSGHEPEDFTALSLDELAAIKVTTVSKKAESLAGVPAAVSVITSDDIRRSGALTIPEALRLAPGVNVGRVNSSDWAVSVRGFNDTFSQKLLVLIDGRSIYSPIFSGTLWQGQDMMLEDADRIEVIRGPGGTVWGANAVNGVINIVSKPARETQGVLVSAGGGTDREGLARVRYGARLGTNTFIRFQTKYDDGSRSRLATSGEANDEWWKAQGGFRLDWEPSVRDRFTAQGDLFAREANSTMPQIVLPTFGVPAPTSGYSFTRQSAFKINGGNALGRWSRQLSDDADVSVQAYFDRQSVRTIVLHEERSTFDFDVRHRFQLGQRNEVVWGGGYRLSKSKLDETREITLREDSRSDQVFNAFIQDEVRLIPERLRWTLGTKVEHNDYTGWEFQPGTRLSWTPTGHQAVWASVARAIRTPSQIEHDARISLSVLPANPPTSPFPTVLTAQGNHQVVAESLVAYELGYRLQAHPRLSLDAALFVNDYDDLRGNTESIDASDAPNFVRLVSKLNNNVSGQTHGGEVGVTWQPLDPWRLSGQVGYLEANLEQPPSALTGQPRSPEIAGARYQLSVRSTLDLGRHVELDVWVRFVDRVDGAGTPIPGLTTLDRTVPSYTTVDVRLAWRPVHNLELALVGQNLAGEHTEFLPTFISTESVKVMPSVYAKVTWKF